MVHAHSSNYPNYSAYLWISFLRDFHASPSPAFPLMAFQEIKKIKKFQKEEDYILLMNNVFLRARNSWWLNSHFLTFNKTFVLLWQWLVWPTRKRSIQWEVQEEKGGGGSKRLSGSQQHCIHLQNKWRCRNGTCGHDQDTRYLDTGGPCLENCKIDVCPLFLPTCHRLWCSTL